jgi:hypothetical protein
MILDDWQYALLLALLVIVLLILVVNNKSVLSSALGLTSSTKTTKKAENFRNVATSYTSGANQRFMTENTDPTLGKQFYPYNFEIDAEKRLLGKQVSQYEQLTSGMEAPSFNTGDFIYPGLVSNLPESEALAKAMFETKAPESGLKPLDKTAEYLMDYA